MVQKQVYSKVNDISYSTNFILQFKKKKNIGINWKYVSNYFSDNYNTSYKPNLLNQMQLCIMKLAVTNKVFICILLSVSYFLDLYSAVAVIVLVQHTDTQRQVIKYKYLQFLNYDLPKTSQNLSKYQFKSDRDSQRVKNREGKLRFFVSGPDSHGK